MGNYFKLLRMKFVALLVAAVVAQDEDPLADAAVCQTMDECEVEGEGCLVTTMDGVTAGVCIDEALGNAAIELAAASEDENAPELRWAGATRLGLALAALTVASYF